MALGKMPALDVAALIISIVAIVVAIVGTGVSALYARRADHRAEADAMARRRPIVTLRQIEKPSSGPRAGQVVHEYEVRAGAVPITGLWLSIVDADGDEISTGAGGEQVTLAPGGGPQFMGVGVLFPERVGQTLMVRWRDADGEYGPESTGIKPHA